jgi:hypothetical protein
MDSYEPGFIINIEARWSQLVNGELNADWYVSWALESWMCCSLQYSVYPPSFSSPTHGKIPFVDLMSKQKYRESAEQLIMTEKFPVLRKGSRSDNWGEYVVLNATKLSIGPSE